jgi:hypothetical protein
LNAIPKAVIFGKALARRIIGVEVEAARDEDFFSFFVIWIKECKHNGVSFQYRASP